MKSGWVEKVNPTDYSKPIIMLNVRIRNSGRGITVTLETPSDFSEKCVKTYKFLKWLIPRFHKIIRRKLIQDGKIITEKQYEKDRQEEREWQESRKQ